MLNRKRARFPPGRTDGQGTSAESFYPVIKDCESGPTTPGGLPEPPVLGGEFSSKGWQEGRDNVLVPMGKKRLSTHAHTGFANLSHFKINKATQTT